MKQLQVLHSRVLCTRSAAFDTCHLQSEGLIKHVGLSEVTAQELRTFHAITPVTAIQMEWSIGTRDLEDTG